MHLPVWLFAPLLLAPLLPILVAMISGIRAVILTTLVLLAGLVVLGWLPARGTEESVDFLSPWWLATAVVVGAILAVLQSRQRMATERRLRQAATDRDALIAELAEKNADLERFTYTVAHDLKSPMTAIYAFLHVLKRDLETGKHGRVEHHLATIRRQVDRMEQLTDDVSAMARIGLGELTREELNVGEVVREAAALVTSQLAEQRVVIDIAADFPGARADRSFLRLVFQTLIENGAKSCIETPEPRVRIGWRRVGEESAYFVQDNGMGLAPEQRDRMFDVNGNGVGLANVKRAVEVHDGRVWIESDPEQGGSTFLFTISP